MLQLQLDESEAQHGTGDVKPRDHFIGSAIILAATVAAVIAIVAGSRVQPPGPSPRCPCATPYATASAP
jgi:hypothetical protein